jgi:hypothetical protein
MIGFKQTSKECWVGEWRGVPKGALASRSTIRQKKKFMEIEKMLGRRVAWRPQGRPRKTIKDSAGEKGI